MRKIFYILTLTAALFALCLASCGIDSAASLKDITKPYIARYECTQATLGDDDLLKDFDYIRITLLDESEMELSFKKKGEKAKAKTFGYTYDNETGSIIAEESILGVKFKEKTIIKDGAFTVSFPLGTRQLTLKFEE